MLQSYLDSRSILGINILREKEMEGERTANFNFEFNSNNSNILKHQAFQKSIR